MGELRKASDAAYQVLLERLRAARREANVTQVELGAKLRTDQSYVSKYESGERRLDIVELREICAALGIDFSVFIQSFESQLRERGL
jgi:transcriptional regulator with XRE-family HTH domain